MGGRRALGHSFPPQWSEGTRIIVGGRRALDQTMHSFPLQWSEGPRIIVRGIKEGTRTTAWGKDWRALRPLVEVLVSRYPMNHIATRVLHVLVSYYSSLYTLLHAVLHCYCFIVVNGVYALTISLLYTLYTISIYNAVVCF